MSRQIGRLLDAARFAALDSPIGPPALVLRMIAGRAALHERSGYSGLLLFSKVMP